MPDQMNPAAAEARRRELLADRGWAARYLAGGAAERRELRQIEAIIARGPSAPQSGPREQALARVAERITDREWAARYLNGDVAARDEMRALNITIAEEHS